MDFIYLKNFFKTFFLFFLLYNTVLVLPYIDMNPPWKSLLLEEDIISKFDS